MSVQDNDLAATYSLIYSFLTERSHFKAAEAVKKAAKGVIIIKGGDRDGPALPIVVKQWKKFMADQGKKATAPSESGRSESSSFDSDSNSSEDSELSSEGSSSEPDTDSDTNSRKPKSDKYSRAKVTPFHPKNPSSPRPKANAKSKVKSPTSKSSPLSSESEESDPSSDSGSSDSDDGEVKKSVPGSTSKGTKAGGTTAVTLPKSGSGDSSNPDSDLESEAPPTPKAVAVREITTSSVHKPRSPAGSSQTLPSIESSDDSDSDSESSGSSTSANDSSSDFNNGSDSDGTPNTGKKSIQKKDKPQKVGVTDTANAPTTVSPRKSNGPTAVTKRRRTDEAGSSVATSIIQQPKPSRPHQNGDSKGKPRKTGTPFSRIAVDKIKFADERLKDNTFGSRMAATNDYGVKANADLIVTRGADFRKEKNKKKRGSYRGGDITMESHSIKFTD